MDKGLNIPLGKDFFTAADGRIIGPDGATDNFIIKNHQGDRVVISAGDKAARDMRAKMGGFKKTK